MTYFRKSLRINYRQRWYVSPICSEWEAVVPYRFNNRKDLKIENKFCPFQKVTQKDQFRLSSLNLTVFKKSQK